MEYDGSVWNRMPPVSAETQNVGAAMSGEMLTMKEVAALPKLAEKTV